MEIKIDQPDGWDSEKNEKDVSDIKDVVLEFEILKGRVKCLEDIDDLREQQITVLKNFIEDYLMLNITPDGSHHGKT